MKIAHTSKYIVLAKDVGYITGLCLFILLVLLVTPLKLVPVSHTLGSAYFSESVQQFVFRSSKNILCVYWGEVMLYHQMIYILKILCINVLIGNGIKNAVWRSWKSPRYFLRVITWYIFYMWVKEKYLANVLFSGQMKIIMARLVINQDTMPRLHTHHLIHN